MKKIIISDDRKLNISNIVVGYLQENKIEKLEFEIPQEYENFGRKACFDANGKTFVKTFDNITGNTITLTRDITQYQDLFMTIAFFKIEDEDEIIARTSTLHILIQGAVICDDDIKPDEPKIIVLDNLIQKVQELDNEISLNENERLENENARQTNEENRINNENLREEYITNLKDKVDDGEFNGKSLEFVWQGTKLGIRLQGQEEYQFVDLVGAVGPIGPQGNPFQVKKTYATINEMINDYENMQINDYVMISGNIEEEDNAKLFVKTENEAPVYRWQYLADFSGASGIQGPIGKTPNLKIGTVSTLNPNENATVEITGTDENPVLNFGIPQGQTYQVNNEDLENIANEITSNANSSFNQNVLTKTNEFNNNATSKVNEYNTNASTKLQEYNDNATQKIEEYDLHSQELNNKIIATRNELERVKNDVLETGTDTDTYIHLEDSAMAEYQELSVDGVCEQKTTTGKQLLPPNFAYKTQTIQGITFTNNGDGSLTLNGTSTGSPVYYLTYNSPITIPSSKVAIRNFNAINGINLRALIEGGSITDNNGNGSISDKELTTINNIYIFVAQGITLKDVKIKPMVCLNEIPNLYEPFTNRQPSPSPDYPEEIKTIENSLKITSCNKNLFDGTGWRIVQSGDGFPNPATGATIVSSDANNISFTSEQSTYAGVESRFINVKANETYMFSAIFTTPTNRFFITQYDKNKTRISTLNDVTSLKNTTFTTTNDGYITIAFTNTTTAQTTYKIENIQLEKGTTATPFEQHLETQITANLPDGEFIGKINDTYKDTLKVEYNEEDGQYHLNLYKNLGKVVLDGSESGWFKSGTTAIDRYGISIDGITSINLSSTRSTHFIYNVGAIIGTYSLSGTNMYFDYGDYNTTTLDDFKTWLSTHNTEVYYALATPYVVDLGIVNMPITYNEITNLFTDSDLMPQINAKYYRNFISTVRNLQVNEKALKQELIDINTRLSALESANTSVTTESEVTE